MATEEMTKALGEAVWSGLESFFALAREHGVSSVTLDCVKRKVNVDFNTDTEPEEDDGGDEHYRKVRKDCNMQKTAKGIIGGCRRQILNNPTEVHYQKIIRQQLEKVLDCSFLIVNEWTCDDSTRVADELSFWNLNDMGYEEKYAVLREMMNLVHNRFVVNEMAVGRYLSLYGESLTQSDTKVFFCFVELCQLVYEKMDELQGVTQGLSAQDKQLFSRLMNYIGKADWQTPATREKAEQFFTELFRDTAFRCFFKEGRSGSAADRVEVSMANILGYLMRWDLLPGSKTKLCMEVFGNENNVNNINKGFKGGNVASQPFLAIEPLMDECRRRVFGC